jgi:alpha-1,2-glucosyltransferase
VILFFAGLYYTDVWSTIFVLLTWSAGVRGKKLQAAILGWVSLWFRQTNVVWVGMAAGMSVVEALGPQTRDPILAPAGGRGATFADFVVNTPFTILVRAVMHPGLLVNGLGPYVFPLASFGGFLVFNGYTIVLGDHSAHTASVNTPQLLYFTVFTLFFSFPLFLPLLPSLPRLIQRPSTIISFVLATFLAGIAVKVNTILHPFLLADNRHYVFYIFRRILLRWGWYSTVAVAPIYVLSGWFMGMSVLRPIAAAASGIKGVRVSTIILYSFSTAAVTVTAGLVEPRYFIIPWILWRVHAIHLPPSPPSLEKKLPKGIINYLAQRKTVLWMETLWFLFINFITVWVFLYRGFEWGSEMGKVQRFMW